MIRLSDVVKEYETGTAALKGISLRIEDGEFVGDENALKLVAGVYHDNLKNYLK